MSIPPTTSGGGAPALTPRTTRALVLMLVSLAFYTALDLGSKEWALDALSRERSGEKPEICMPDANGYTRMQRIPHDTVEIVPGYFDLSYAENCGAAFGMLRTAPSWMRASVFGLAALGAFVVLTMMFMRGTGGALFGAAVPLILSGALGNIADRVRHGFVVDFIHVHARDAWHYPTFNVADCTITIGVVLLLLDGVKKPAPAVSASPPEARVREG